jgi:Na+/melibiose symporter-like transporter
MALLAVPAMALALATTTVTSYMPVLAKSFTSSSTVIGVVVGAEGFLALWLPLAAGTWSDQVRTRIGGRLPFLLVATPVVTVALALMGFVSSIGQMALVVFVFFVGYLLAYEPYRALYPDAVPDRQAAKSQGVRGVAQGIGTGLALVGGGLLFGIAKPVPFLAAAAVVPVAVVLFTRHLVRRRIPSQDYDERQSLRDNARDLAALLREHPALRHFLVANGLWELSLSALKTFVVLYITVAVGLSLDASSAVLGAAIVCVMGAAAAAAKLGDRLGKLRLMKFALPVYGAGLLIPFVTQSPFVLGPVVPVLAFGGGLIMTLPYAILMPLMPEEEHGALTGFYSLSRGVGTMLGPLFAGLAISLSGGYPAMWLVSAGAILASVAFLLALERSAADRDALQTA